MRREEPLIVRLSRLRLALLAFSAAGFVALGAVLWTVSDVQEQRGPVVMRAAAIASVAIFAPVLVYALVKLFDSTPGLVIDELGIVDNAGGGSVGRVPWDDILDVRMTQVGRQRFLTFLVSDPQKYARRGNLLKRRLAALNLQHFGSPVHVSASALAIRFDDLVRAVAQAFQRHKSSRA